MSYRLLMWVTAAAVLVAIVTVIDLAKEREDGPVFIASNGPLTEDQVRQKLVADGWANVQIRREGRYFQVMGSKDQQTAHLVVDSQTGRLRGDDDD
jgi:ABC-type phosphate transport system auxiliary subunit